MGVVRVSEEDALRFAEELRPAQPGEIDEVTADYGVEDGAPAWPEDGTEPPSGDASEGETGAGTPEQEQLRDACRDGSMAACDELWAITPVGSELEAFAEACGGRHTGTCTDDVPSGS